MSINTIYAAIAITVICITAIIIVVLLIKSKTGLKIGKSGIQIDTKSKNGKINVKTILKQKRNLEKDIDRIYNKEIKSRQMGYAERQTYELVNSLVDNYLNELEKYVEENEIKINLKDNVRNLRFVKEFEDIIADIGRENLKVVSMACDINGFTKKSNDSFDEYIDRKCNTFLRNAKVELDKKYSEEEFILPYDNYAETVRADNYSAVKRFAKELFFELRTIAKDYEDIISQKESEVDDLEELLISNYFS